jgi:hypothetical protein
MTTARKLLLVLSHFSVGALGFALGIYMLPILMAPAPPQPEQVAAVEEGADYQGDFRRDLKDSDFLHWGEGTVSLSSAAIVFRGELAPGPDYRLYLSPQFVETEAEFEALKSQMIQIGKIDTFENFVVSVPEGVSLDEYSAVIVWCESFGQFITAAQYR